MLSVIIPTYNDAEKILVAVASAIQVKSVNEIIIIDDYSKDNTEELLKNVIKKNKKIKYFKNKKNIGSGLSFIKGIQKVNNNYLIMLNSDDFFIPEGIEKLLNFIRKFDLDVAYGKMAIKKNNEVFQFTHPGYKKNSYVRSRDEFLDLLIYDMYMPSFGTVIKKKAINQFYDTNYYNNLKLEYGGDFKAHDYDLFINLAKQKKKFGFLNEIVCVWCQTRESQSGEKYFNSGDACFESSFLFNKYFKNTYIDKKNLFKILLRIKGKFNKRKPGLKENTNHFYHYTNFLKKMKKALV